MNGFSRRGYVSRALPECRMYLYIGYGWARLSKHDGTTESIISDIIDDRPDKIYSWIKNTINKWQLE